MTDEDFEKAKSEKDKTIHILHFTDLNSIRPIYYDKTYHAVPEAGGDKAFELLRKAMTKQDKRQRLDPEELNLYLKYCKALAKLVGLRRATEIMRDLIKIIT